MLSVWKPWYIHRPRQLVARAVRAVRGTPAGTVVVALPWGVEVAIDPRETIGRAIWTTGVYDLALSEVLARLMPPGGLAVDAGANIGYMTGLLAVRAGKGGEVFAFEPNPAVVGRLRENVERVSRHPAAARVEVRAEALTDTPGTARLVCPAGFDANNGVGRLTTADEPGAVDVPAVRLDDLFPERTIDVLKVDVEGHESAVFRGAGRLLADGRIRHVLFEEHDGPQSAACEVLRAAGYELHQVGWRMNGPALAPATDPPITRDYEAPSYLATRDPAAAVTCRVPGWSVLRGWA